MHIAKAGGSTVNAFLNSRFPAGRFQAHIQSLPQWQEDPQALRSLDGLSGHVDLKTLERRLGLDGFRLVTVMRQPWRQLISHMVWIRRLAEPEEAERLAQHPEFVAVLANKLRSCDFSDPASVTAFRTSLAAQERALLDNCQVRYFAAPETPWVDHGAQQAAIDAVPRFHRIGTVERLDEFLDGLCDDMGWPRQPRPARENVTPAFFGLDTLSGAVQAALRPLIRHDEALFAAAVPPPPKGWRRWPVFRALQRKG